MANLPKTPTPETSGGPWVNCDLLPAEIDALIAHHQVAAADLRKDGDRVGAARVKARISELRLALTLEGRAP